MGLVRRVVRKSVRKATPRSVRKAMHPVRTARRAVTPPPVRKVTRALYTVTNPLGAAENALIGSVLNVGGHRRSSSRSGSRSASTRTTSGEIFVGTGIRATEALVSHDRLAGAVPTLAFPVRLAALVVTSLGQNMLAQ